MNAQQMKTSNPSTPSTIIGCLLCILFAIPQGTFAADKKADAKQEQNAESSFDTDDPSAAFTENQPIKPGKYAGGEAKEVAARIMKKVEAVNRCWLYAPPGEVENWGYTFKAASKTGGGTMEKKITLDRSGSAPWEKIRGITYIGVPQGLCDYAREGSAEFKSVEVTEKEMKLHFLIQENGGAFQMIGNGLDGQWFGFFQRKVPEGMLYVNAKDFTIVGVKMPKNAYEKYTGYTKIDDERFVPKRIEIVSGDMAFDMRFKVYKPGLWLLDQSVMKLKKKETSTVKISDVLVNGTGGTEAE